MDLVLAVADCAAAPADALADTFGLAEGDAVADEQLQLLIGAGCRPITDT
ncbi:hypothetical protein [Promicromonospora sp. NPDC059942]